MKSILKRVFILQIFVLSIFDVSAQIVINGHNPRRIEAPDLKNAIVVSYGNVLWIDGENVPLTGYSSSRESLHGLRDPHSIEKKNVSVGMNVGIERYLSPKVTLRAALYIAKLATGLANRDDLIAEDESRIMQFGLYSKYALTKNSRHRLQFQWLAGPELIYVKKNILIDEYVENGEAPVPYRQNISILEGAIVTGLGISFRVSNAILIFSDGMLGISLPGAGLKTSNTLLGLSYRW